MFRCKGENAAGRVQITDFGFALPRSKVTVADTIRFYNETNWWTVLDAYMIGDMVNNIILADETSEEKDQLRSVEHVLKTFDGPDIKGKTSDGTISGKSILDGKFDNTT